jgi:hypothetical protein
MGLVLLALVVGGFAPQAFIRPGGVSAMPILLHVHGAVFFSWFALFCMQARLVGVGNIALHKRLGQLSMLLALTMIVLAYFVVRDAYARPDFSIAGMSGAASVMFPFTDIVNFAIAYGLALTYRATPFIHKRCMLVAGILMMDPAVARLVFTLGAPAPLILIIEVALFVALIAYDVKTRSRPSWPAMLGLGLYAAAMGAKLTLAQQPGWARFVEVLFG